MGFWKRLIGLEKKEDLEVDSITEEQNATISVTKIDREFLNEKCSICGNVIGTEKRRKGGGKLFHKKCFNDQYKQMKAQGRVI